MKISFNQAETTKIIIAIEDDDAQETSNVYEIFMAGTLGKDTNFSKAEDVLEEATHPTILGAPAIMNLDNDGTLSFLVKFRKHLKGKGAWLALEITQDSCSNIVQVKNTVKTPDTHLLSLEELLAMKSRKSMTKRLQEVDDASENEKERDVVTTAITDSSLLDHFTKPSPGLTQRILWDLVESAIEDKVLGKSEWFKSMSDVAMMSIKNAQDIAPMKRGLETKRVTQNQKNFKDSILILSNELQTYILTKKKKDAASVDLTSELMAVKASPNTEKQSEGIAGTFI